MKKRDRRVLADYIRSTADQMGLRDWEIRLEPEPCDEGCCAHVKMPFGRKLAKVYVEKEFRTKQSPQDQRDTIVHELIHLHFEPMASMVRADLGQIIGQAADHVFFAGFERQFEYGVDAMAGALAKHMPLIDWR